MIVAGPKIDQLTPMSIGPRFLSPEESIIAALWSIETNETDTVKPGKPSVQSSLASSRCLDARRVEGTTSGVVKLNRMEMRWDSRLAKLSTTPYVPPYLLVY